MAAIEELELEAVIGFAGNVPGGLKLHKDQDHLIYPLGSTIVYKKLLKNCQSFLIGHKNKISCLAINQDCTLLASGEEAPMGFPANVIVWDLTTMEMKYELELHRAKVQHLCFSHDSAYLATLGGEDDNKIILWDMETGNAICGNPAHTESAKVIAFFNNTNDTFITAGNYHIRSWQIDRANRKLRPTDCNLASIKRVVSSLYIDQDDQRFYAGTMSGDVLCIDANSKLFKSIGPSKKPFSCGVRQIIGVNENHIVVGSGDGTIALLDKKKLAVRKRVQLDGSVTSLQINQENDHFFVGTSKCNIYCVAVDDFEYELRRSGHYQQIASVAFPHDYSNLFVTASNDVRVWNRSTTKELLRIQIPNISCKCVVVSHDGKMIITGWSDGKIRGFLPKTGRLLFAINDAHKGDVNTIKLCRTGEILVSGGEDGRVRVWQMSIEQQTLIISWKEHKCPVTQIELNDDETFMFSSSGDGSCILWDLQKLNRVNALFSQNQFTDILYHPDQSQLITTGADRKITWWDAVDMEPIRILDGSDSAQINSLGMMNDGECFVSGGADLLVKLWKYDEGIVTNIGYGHSGAINKVVISPNNKHIVSVGDEGGIFIWKFPEHVPHNEILA